MPIGTSVMPTVATTSVTSSPPKATCRQGQAGHATHQQEESQQREDGEHEDGVPEFPGMRGHSGTEAGQREHVTRSTRQRSDVGVAGRT